MSVSICRSFQRLFGHLIVPLEASCRCLKHSSPRLSEIGRLDEVRDLTNRYETGQLFIHKKLSCRGVILHPWTAKVFNRDSMTKKNENQSADSNQNASVLHEKAKTHPYYQVLMDCRDSDYASVPLDSSVLITDHGNQKQYWAAIRGLDYVAHTDIMPYITTETTTPIDNELFDVFLMPKPDNSSAFIPRHAFPAWQKENYSQLRLTCVYIETTNNVRVTVIPFYLGSLRKEENSYWWRYSIRLENLDEQAVQVVSKNLQVFSTSGSLDRIVERPATKSGRDGREAGVVLSRKSPVYQFNNLLNLQAPSGHVWGTFTVVREDDTKMDCTIPAFALEVNHDDKTDPDPNFNLIG